MYSFQGAPIMNKGYYDVPINNQYSNKEIRDKPFITNQYEFNKKINVTNNDNKSEYVVYQDPTVPSPSLYLETDQPMSGYYYKDPMSLSFDGAEPLVKKKEQSKVYNYINSDNSPQKNIERFHGGGGMCGGMGGGMGGGGMGHGGSHSGNGGHGGHGGHGGYRGGGGYGGGYSNGLYAGSYVSPYYWNVPAYDYIPNNYGYIAPEVVVEKPVIIQQPIKEPKEEYTYDTDDSVKIVNINQNKKDKKKKIKKEYNNKFLWALIFLLIIINLFFIVRITLYSK
jgi:hypothetical protein